MNSLTTRQIKKALAPLGHNSYSWIPSSRISGWGSLSRGYEITPDVKLRFSEKRIRGKWRTFQKQTGVFAITFCFGEHSKGNDNLAEVLTQIADTLNAAGIKATLDLKGKHTVYGKDQHVSGAKVVVGDLSVLSEPHY